MTKRKTGPLGKAGRKAYRPTDEQRDKVRTASGHGAPVHEIASLIGIADKTLVKYFGKELEDGRVVARAGMRQNLYNKAMGQGPQAVAAAIFWAKTQMGWKEPPHEHRLAGPNGGPIQHVDLSKLSDEQLDALERILTQATRAGNGGSDSGGTPEKGDGSSS